MYEFLQEIDGEDRRKSAPEIGRKSGKDTTASAETKRAERKTAPLYAKSEPENNQHEKVIDIHSKIYLFYNLHKQNAKT